MLLALNLDKDLINEKFITISLMFASQPRCVFGFKSIAPETN